MLLQGSLPIEWTVTVGPLGLGINSLTGQVSWPSPSLSGSPHAITIRAANGVGFDEESWTLTVSAPVSSAVAPVEWLIYE